MVLAGVFAALILGGDRLRCDDEDAVLLDRSSAAVEAAVLCLGERTACFGVDVGTIGSRRAVAMTRLSRDLSGPAMDREGSVLMMSGKFFWKDSSSSES